MEEIDTLVGKLLSKDESWCVPANIVPGRFKVKFRQTSNQQRQNRLDLQRRVHQLI
jgi:hypothetical protein